MKKFKSILWKVVIITTILISINIVVELFRIKNSFANKPFIVLTERSSPNHYYYYGIGFSEEFIYKNDKLEEVKFRLFNKFVIWSAKKWKENYYY